MSVNFIDALNKLAQMRNVLIEGQLAIQSGGKCRACEGKGGWNNGTICSVCSGSGKAVSVPKVLSDANMMLTGLNEALKKVGIE